MIAYFGPRPFELALELIRQERMKIKKQVFYRDEILERYVNGEQITDEEISEIRIILNKEKAFEKRRLSLDNE